MGDSARNPVKIKRPSFQFYPADWRKDPLLRRCSFHLRGVWMELICLLHESEEYGVLRWPRKDIAHAVGCRVSDIQELIKIGVLSGCEHGECEPVFYTATHAGRTSEPIELLPNRGGPIYFGRRLLRDEHIRNVRSEYGYKSLELQETRFTKGPPKGLPKGGIGPTFGTPPSSSSSSSSSDREETRVHKTNKGASPSARTSDFILPDWIPADAWNGFLEMRKRIKKPLTDRAMTLAVGTLERLRAQGQDPAAVLDQSTLNTWQGLFAVKPEAKGKQSLTQLNFTKEQFTNGKF